MTPRTETLCVAAGSAGMALGYALVPLLHPPMFWFDPVAWVWSMGSAPTPLAMGFFARCLYAIASGLLAALAARLVLSRRTPRGAIVGFAAFVGVVALAASLTFEARRTAVPTAPLSPSAIALRSSAVPLTQETP